MAFPYNDGLTHATTSVLHRQRTEQGRGQQRDDNLDKGKSSLFVKERWFSKHATRRTGYSERVYRTILRKPRNQKERNWNKEEKADTSRANRRSHKVTTLPTYY